MIGQSAKSRSSGNHMGDTSGAGASGGDSTPICRCRVVYLGSSVPHVTKDGLQGIQQPLKELYPESGISGAKGIDSWLSVWSNGLLLENVDEKNKKVTRFFPIESLHYCAAVRFVVVPGGGTGSDKVARFLPLDSPFARSPSTSHRPLFACILRRTTGIKVLECHAFICKKENPANALVRCCFHAYADNMYARQIEGGSPAYGTLSTYGNVQTQSIEEHLDLTDDASAGGGTIVNGHSGGGSRNGAVVNGNGDLSTDEISIYNGDENHKIWAGSQNGVNGGSHDVSESLYQDGEINTLRSVRSMASSRPRQLSAPVPAPPPPMALHPSPMDIKKKSKTKRKSKDSSPGVMANGYLMNGGTLPPQSSSSMGHYGPRRPASVMNGHPPMMRPPPMMISPGRRPVPVMYGTYSERRPRMIPMPPPPPHPHPMMMGPMGPMPPPVMMPMMGPPPMAIGARGRPPSRIMEEPIYMPSARPMSPIASYQPGHFPHEDYYFQYATIDRPQKYNKKKKSKGNKEGAMESSFNSGIYKKRGHLNERAFSYSIRQEDRSRSYGSLANIPFAANGDMLPSPGKEPSIKEREMLQMVQDLDLSGDDLERQEVPPSMYHHMGHQGKRMVGRKA